MTTQEIRTEIEKLVAAGDEKALETFMLEHFADLPEDAQGKMLLSLVQEAVSARATDSEITDLQEAGLKALEKLQAEQK